MCRDENGFTLPELLGVITLLALIVILAIPVVAENIASGKNNLYKVQIDSFEEAAKNWMALHVLEVPEEVDTTITLGCLKAEGLLELEIENPLTGEQFPNDMIIKIQSSSNQYIYIVDEDSGSAGNKDLPSEKCHFNSTAITN